MNPCSGERRESGQWHKAGVQAMINRFLNIQEAAEYLRMSRWYLYKMVERRRVPFIPVSAGPKVYSSRRN